VLLNTPFKMEGPSETDSLLHQGVPNHIAVEGYSSLQHEANRGANCSHGTDITLHFCDTKVFDIVPDAKKQLGMCRRRLWGICMTYRSLCLRSRQHSDAYIQQGDWNGVGCEKIRNSW
jgi:hypothetical protein